MLTNQEKEILRQLASEYMSYASLPVQKEKISLWKSLNRSKMQRPMVTIDQLPWNELVCDELVCKVSDPIFRNVENYLRKAIYKWKNFPVDMVLDPFIPVSKSVVNSGYGIHGITHLIGAETTAPSQHYENVLQHTEDIEKIKDMTFSIDEEDTKLHEAEAHEIFDGIAPVLMTGGVGFHLGIWDAISCLMGVEDIYYDLVDRPGHIHAILNRFTESAIHGIEEANRLELHDDTTNLCHCSHIYTDELLPDSGQSKGPNSKNCWAFGLAQLFTSVGKDTFEEFELPYISRMAEYFGMIYYGCCDRLDDRLDVVKKIPNVKKVSCSPWSDRNAFAEKIGGALTMSIKPTPAFLATGIFDKDIIKKDIEDACNLAKKNNLNMEFLLKDISTVQNQPSRITEWANLVMGIVESY